MNKIDGKTWYQIQPGAIIQYPIFDEDGNHIGTKTLEAQTEICVYMESESVKVKEVFHETI